MANEICHENSVACLVQVNSVLPVYRHRPSEVVMPNAAHAHITEERVHHLFDIPPGPIEATWCTTSPTHPNFAFTETETKRHHQHKITPELVDKLHPVGVAQIVSSSMDASVMVRMCV